MFTYLFAKVTSKQEINIQTVIINNNETVLLSIDVGNFDSFSKYFQFVNRKCRDKDAIKYDIKDILKLNVERNPEEILVVYCVKSLITSNIRLLNIYDIIFEVEEKMDRVSFVCEFNDGRLKEDKVEEIIKLYLKLIDMMLVKY